MNKSSLTPVVYCVFCGFDSESRFMVCETDAVVLGVKRSYVPVTCGDDVCYCLPNAEVNFDGDCGHYEIFRAKLNRYFPSAY